MIDELDHEFSFTSLTLMSLFHVSPQPSDVQPLSNWRKKLSASLRSGIRPCEQLLLVDIFLPRGISTKKDVSREFCFPFDRTLTEGSVVSRYLTFMLFIEAAALFRKTEYQN